MLREINNNNNDENRNTSNQTPKKVQYYQGTYEKGVLSKEFKYSSCKANKKSSFDKNSNLINFKTKYNLSDEKEFNDLKKELEAKDYDCSNLYLNFQNCDLKQVEYNFNNWLNSDLKSKNIENLKNLSLDFSNLNLNNEN